MTTSSAALDIPLNADTLSPRPARPEPTRPQHVTKIQPNSADIVRRQLRETYYTWAQRAVSQGGLGKQYQLHHIVTQTLFDDGGHISKWLDQIGVLRNEAANIVTLPTKKALQKGVVTDAALHGGRHVDDYMLKRIRDPLAELATREFSETWTKEMAQKAVREMQQGVRKELLSGAIKLQRYDSALTRSRWIQGVFASTMTAYLATGVSAQEAEEVAMQRVEVALRNEGYYRNQASIIRYGTAGYYAGESCGFLRGVAFTVDLFNPIEDIMVLGNLADDAGNVWGEFLSE